MPFVQEGVGGHLPLKGEQVPVHYGVMPHGDLRFYTDNPRIYTLVGRSESIPSQEEIEETLLRMDHVNGLIQSIRAHGGLIDRVLVRDDDFVVLEGNSRLAAYRWLARLDPIRWGMMRVTLLPADIRDDLVFALLGQYHLVGKKDWQPYEQAGYYYRRHMDHDVPVNTIASEMAISSRKVQRLIDTYDFMVRHNESSIDRWSYYEEYLKNPAIKHARRENPTMDEVVVRKIRSGEIPRAIEIRDNLSVIAKAGGRALNKFLREEGSFDEAVEMTADRSDWYERISRFKRQLAGSEQELRNLSPEQRRKCAYELKKIRQILDTILPRIQGP